MLLRNPLKMFGAQNYICLTNIKLLMYRNELSYISENIRTVTKQENHSKHQFETRNLITLVLESKKTTI